MPVTHYRTSDGREVEIAEMAYPHLKNATNKLSASIHEQPGREHELAAMMAEVARRDAELDELIRTGQEEGLRETFDAEAARYYVTDATGLILSKAHKDRRAAYAEVFMARGHALK